MKFPGIVCVILLTLLFSSFIQAQSWRPFPYQQTSYFANPDTALSPNNFYEYKNDTIAVRGGDSVLFFNRFPVANNHSICFYNIKTMLGDSIEFDSLILSNGKYYYFQFGDTVIFNPSAVPGNSWAINCANGGNNFDHIIIRCDSADMASVYGNVDSIKYFSLQAYKGASPVNYYNRYTYRLSKSFGLLNFLPFKYLLYHTDSIQSHTYLMQGLLKDSTVTIGFKLPTFRDYFFHYHVGDVYAWENSYFITGYGYVNNYSYLDTITKVDTLPDVVKLYFKGEFLSSKDSIVFSKNDYADYIDKTPPHIGFGNSLGYEWGIFTNQISYDSCFGTVLNSSSSSGIDSGCLYQPPFEASAYTDLSSKIGLISTVEYSLVGNGFPATAITSISITGYKLYDGTTCSSNGYPLGASEIKKEQTQAFLCPNPFDEQTTLIIKASLPVRNLTFSLFDVTGRLVRKVSNISSQATTLSRNGLASGIYFYQLTRGGIELSNGKLIVQ